MELHRFGLLSKARAHHETALPSEHMYIGAAGEDESSAAERTAAERTAAERTAAERTAAERTAAERTAPERTAAERTAAERTAPERSGGAPAQAQARAYITGLAADTRR